MNENEIFTIEINLADNFANACAYHVDSFKNTSITNLRAACEKNCSTDKWALVGLARSLSEAIDKAEVLRQTLCKRHSRKSYGIEELLEMVHTQEYDYE